MNNPDAVKQTLNRKAAEAAEEEARLEAQAAFDKARASSKAAKEKADAERDAAQPAGIIAGNPNAPVEPLDNTDTNPGDRTLKHGWIKCADGKYVRDKGGSIYIEGRPPTTAQLQKIEELRVQKGWPSVALWRTNLSEIDVEITQMANTMGIPCVMKPMGSFGRSVSEGVKQAKLTLGLV